jgi:hypothetical protein
LADIALNWKMLINLVASAGNPVKKEAMDTCLLLTVLTMSGGCPRMRFSTKSSDFPEKNARNILYMPVLFYENFQILTKNPILGQPLRR